MKQLALSVIFLFLLSCRHDTVENEVSPSPVVIDSGCFNTQIRPVFLTYCATSGCHDAFSNKGHYNFTSYEGISSGMVPYKPDQGPIMLSLTQTDPQQMMPPAGPLSPGQVSLIKEWISQGAMNTTCANACDTFLVKYTSHIRPLIGSRCQSCHTSQAPFLNTYEETRNAMMDGKLLCSIRWEKGCVPMPDSLTRMSNCEVRLFEKWLSTGCPL